MTFEVDQITNLNMTGNAVLPTKIKNPIGIRRAYLLAREIIEVSMRERPQLVKADVI